MPDYAIKCRVTVRDAVMIVTADNPDDALAKAKAGDWSDVEYDQAEMADWETTGKPQEA